MKFESRYPGDEYQNHDTKRSGEILHLRKENRFIVSLIGGMLIISFFLVPITVGVYLLLR